VAASHGFKIYLRRFSGSIEVNEMSQEKNLFRRLSLAAGPPGAEGEVRKIVRESLTGLGTFSYDRLGSILCEKKGQSEQPRVVLDSHMDEVAFMLQSVSEEGKLAMVPLGGWWGHVLLGQRVEVLGESGKVPGVIGSKPPHFLAESERNKVLGIDKMYVDIGASTRKEVEQLGIQVGDPIVPYSEFVECAVPGVISGKAFDNRAGVGLMCEVMRSLAECDHPNTVIGVGSVQEEVGCRGGGTSSEVARPDVAIVLEATPADDTPGFTERQAILGKGPQIRLFDPTAISNRRLVRKVLEVANAEGLAVQQAVRRTGGTDANTIHRHRHGVPTVVIGVPSRYIHTHASMLQWADYLTARKLVKELVLQLDQDAVSRLVDFSDDSTD
jgi:putative aminopeptidase FrvX